MGILEISLLAVAALILAANQALKDAPILTARFQWLRPKSWWNYLPMAFLAFAVFAYGFSWIGKPSLEVTANSMPRVTGDIVPIPILRRTEPAAGERPDPTTLPATISRNYVALMSDDHSDIQKQRLLAQNAGKYLDLNLELVSVERSGKWLRAQFSTGQNSDTFVYFAPAWEDHLAAKMIGDPVHFRAKIVSGRPQPSLG